MKTKNKCVRENGNIYAKDEEHCSNGITCIVYYEYSELVKDFPKIENHSIIATYFYGENEDGVVYFKRDGMLELMYSLGFGKSLIKSTVLENEKLDTEGIFETEATRQERYRISREKTAVWVEGKKYYKREKTESELLEEAYKVLDLYVLEEADEV